LEIFLAGQGQPVACCNLILALH